MFDKISVGILGCTGMVGQRFVVLLESHPLFKVTHLAASSKSAGKSYDQAVNWKLPSPLPIDIAKQTVVECDPAIFLFSDCKMVFSGLDSSVAGEIELAFASKGFAVFSNAKNHRMDPLVPLVVPLANSHHIDRVVYQMKANQRKGFIVTNANCSTTGLVVVLKALKKLGKLKSVIVTTMQAMSGAGYPGVSGMDMLDNVVPFIGEEEEKMETEPLKILGEWNEEKVGFVDAEAFPISASCNRVPVLDGHTECVYIQFEDNQPTVEEVAKCLETYHCEAQFLNVFSAPNKAIVVRKEKDRPQPRLDREEGRGMSVVVGRIRNCPVLGIKLVLLSHNTIVGAAGSAIMNAEIALKKGLFK